tara:strand:+ start:4818 stop:5645 length:828 start_codon:yes stop_codon:yes gene_type:complete
MSEESIPDAAPETSGLDPSFSNAHEGAAAHLASEGGEGDGASTESTQGVDEDVPAGQQGEASSDDGSQIYEVPEDEQPEGGTEYVYNGNTLNMTPEEVNQVLYHGLRSLEDAAAAQQQEQQHQAMGAVPPDAIADLTGKISQLEGRLQATQREASIEKEAQRIEQAISGELEKYDVFKENPDLHALARDSAMTMMNANPRMSEGDAMKSVATKFSTAFNSQFQKYVQGKIKDGESAEGGAGGASATPTPPQLGRKELMNGGVLAAALRAPNESFS